MKVYNLTIVYDEDGDTIEYIEETLDDDNEGSYLKQLAKEEGWDSSTTLSVLQGIIEKAEAQELYLTLRVNANGTI